jgi:hypothetical protein
MYIHTGIAPPPRCFPYLPAQLRGPVPESAFPGRCPRPPARPPRRRRSLADLHRCTGTPAPLHPVRRVRRVSFRLLRPPTAPPTLPTAHPWLQPLQRPGRPHRPRCAGRCSELRVCVCMHVYLYTAVHACIPLCSAAYVCMHVYHFAAPRMFACMFTTLYTAGRSLESQLAALAARLAGPRDAAAAPRPHLPCIHGRLDTQALYIYIYIYI